MGQARTRPRPVLIGALLVAVAILVAFAVVDNDPTGQMTGIVVGVDGDLIDVESFDVLSNGETIRVVPAEDGDFDFPLGHLRDHLRTGEPVTVEYERLDGVLIATRVSDGR